MTERTLDLTMIQTMAILHRYGFDLKGYTPMELTQQWGQKYSAVWIRLAVIEALYQGRYKSFSVEQILKQWLRKGKPGVHFSHEFERLVCRKLPQVNEMGTPPENSPAVTLKPDLSSPLKPSETTSNSPEKAEESSSVLATVSSESKSISQFTPLVDHSQSYTKLREVAYKRLEESNKTLNKLEE